MSNELSQSQSYTHSRALIYSVIFLMSFEIYFVSSLIYYVIAASMKGALFQLFQSSDVKDIISDGAVAMLTVQIAGFVGAGVILVLQRIIARYQALGNAPIFSLFFLIILASLPFVVLSILTAALIAIFPTFFTDMSMFGLVGYIYILLLGLILSISQGAVVFQCLKSLFKKI